MFAKIDVNGDAEAAVYTMMKAEQPGEGDTADVAWNFEKFLVGPDGATIARWGTRTTPEEIKAELATIIGS